MQKININNNPLPLPLPLPRSRASRNKLSRSKQLHQLYQRHTHQLYQPHHPYHMPQSSLPSMGFVRLPTILRLFPISKSTWWLGIKIGRFPKGIKISSNITAWRAEDIHSLIKGSSMNSLDENAGGGVGGIGGSAGESSDYRSIDEQTPRSAKAAREATAKSEKEVAS